MVVFKLPVYTYFFFARYLEACAEDWSLFEGAKHLHVAILGFPAIPPRSRSNQKHQFHSTHCLYRAESSMLPAHLQPAKALVHKPLCYLPIPSPPTRFFSPPTRRRPNTALCQTRPRIQEHRRRRTWRFHLRAAGVRSGERESAQRAPRAAGHDVRCRHRAGSRVWRAEAPTTGNFVRSLGRCTPRSLTGSLAGWLG
jgi:hypothetical protein